MLLIITIMFVITQIWLPITIVFTPKIQYLYKVEKQEKISYKHPQRWNISIPNIDLYAPISDGIEAEILNKYVGHFTQSGYILGNISLAAHNRGFPINYFENLKNLKIGDEIIYEYKDLELKYIISNIKIINDTDVEVVENTKENKITLITCVENKPDKRRCIQGKLII